MRFSYVKYDEESTKQSEEAKALVEQIEMFVMNNLGGGRPQSLALTSLEETFMWIGKAIRDNQILKGSAVAHVPERTNG